MAIGGGWLVEIFSAVIDSCVDFFFSFFLLGGGGETGRSPRKSFCPFLLRRREGRIWRSILGSVFLLLCVTSAKWPESRRHGCTLAVSPHLVRDDADLRGRILLTHSLFVLPPSHHPQESVGLTQWGQNGFNWSPSFQLSLSPDSFLKVQSAHCYVTKSPLP